MNSAVQRAIRFIRENYSEPLSLDDIAGSAIMSRFHFCRIFAGATGVTPGRFLSAIRIYEAKRMLLNTAMNVTDVITQLILLLVAQDGERCDGRDELIVAKCLKAGNRAAG